MPQLNEQRTETEQLFVCECVFERTSSGTKFFAVCALGVSQRIVRSLPVRRQPVSQSVSRSAIQSASASLSLCVCVCVCVLQREFVVVRVLDDNEEEEISAGLVATKAAKYTQKLQHSLFRRNSQVA